MEERREVRAEERGKSGGEESKRGVAWRRNHRGLSGSGVCRREGPQSQTELKSITIARAEAIEAEQTQHTRPFSRNCKSVLVRQMTRTPTAMSKGRTDRRTDRHNCGAQTIEPSSPTDQRHIGKCLRNWVAAELLQTATDHPGSEPEAEPEAEPGPEP